jgi:ribosomal protein S5
VKINTKVTTLNRINSYKTLLFMGNGNGIISYAKGKGINPSESLDRAIYLLKKNLIAIPRDSRCTLPIPIRKRFQDYRLYLRPNVGFNAHGHPLVAFMLGFAGIEHAGFHVSHTEKNIYNILKVFYKAVTTNTTPQ